MEITILCSSPSHPVNATLQRWMEKHSDGHKVQLARKKSELTGGDLLFLISCSEIIRDVDRKRFKKVLVIHASDLPKGRGWSPHIWAIVNGATRITVSLLEAEDKVDSGDIWKKIDIQVPKHALFDEINELVFEAEYQLMTFAVENFQTIIPLSQNKNEEPTYYPRRSPADSELDPEKSLREQFDLIRVCDPERFPAFFKLNGHTYKLTLEKMDNE